MPASRRRRTALRRDARRLDGSRTAPGPKEPRRRNAPRLASRRRLAAPALCRLELCCASPSPARGARRLSRLSPRSSGHRSRDGARARGGGDASVARGARARARRRARRYVAAASRAARSDASARAFAVASPGARDLDAGRGAARGRCDKRASAPRLARAGTRRPVARGQHAAPRDARALGRTSTRRALARAAVGAGGDSRAAEVRAAPEALLARFFFLADADGASAPPRAGGRAARRRASLEAPSFTATEIDAAPEALLGRERRAEGARGRKCSNAARRARAAASAADAVADWEARVHLDGPRRAPPTRRLREAKQTASCRRRIGDAVSRRAAGGAPVARSRSIARRRRRFRPPQSDERRRSARRHSVARPNRRGIARGALRRVRAARRAQGKRPASRTPSRTLAARRRGGGLATLARRREAPEPRLGSRGDATLVAAGGRDDDARGPRAIAPRAAAASARAAAANPAGRRSARVAARGLIVAVVGESAAVGEGAAQAGDRQRRASTAAARRHRRPLRRRASATWTPTSEHSEARAAAADLTGRRRRSRAPDAPRGRGPRGVRQAGGDKRDSANDGGDETQPFHQPGRPRPTRAQPSAASSTCPRAARRPTTVEDEAPHRRGAAARCRSPVRRAHLASAVPSRGRCRQLGKREAISFGRRGSPLARGEGGAVARRRVHPASRSPRPFSRRRAPARSVRSGEPRLVTALGVRTLAITRGARASVASLPRPRRPSACARTSPATTSPPAARSERAAARRASVQPSALPRWRARTRRARARRAADLSATAVSARRALGGEARPGGARRKTSLRESATRVRRLAPGS